MLSAVASLEIFTAEKRVKRVFAEFFFFLCVTSASHVLCGCVFESFTSEKGVNGVLRRDIIFLRVTSASHVVRG
jgi:hypothetical protein